MSAGPDFAFIHGPNAEDAISATRQQPLNPPLIHRLEGLPVIRVPRQLRLHPALEELRWAGVIEEFNDATRLTHPLIREPIQITTNGTILSGFGRWRSAVFDREPEVNCIEYPLDEDQSLQFILSHHKTRYGWNAFIRIRLALSLESNLQQRAVDNMRAGGKHKGSAKLPEAQHVDVRQEIADVAGAGSRSVSKVKTILKVGHPQLIEALQSGALKIDRAIQFCKLPRAAQFEQFIRYSEERATNKVIRRSIPRPKEEKTRLDIGAVLDVIKQLEERQPGSVAVRVGRHKRTVVLVGRDLFSETYSQKEVELT